MKTPILILPMIAILALFACDDTSRQTSENMSDQSRDNINQPTQVSADQQAPDISSDHTQNNQSDNLEHLEKTDKQVDDSELKKDTIEHLYRDTVLSYNTDDSADGIDTLFNYADKKLQSAIMLVKADIDGISDCNQVRYILNLTVGNGYSIEEAADVKYRILDNGKIRASILFQGDEDIDDSSFDSYKDFSLSCSSGSCKVTDMFDSEGNSAIQDVDKYCR